MHNALSDALSEPLRFLVSYAHKDGADLAQSLRSDLANEDFDVWLDKPRLSGGAPAASNDMANLVVLVVS